MTDINDENINGQGMGVEEGGDNFQPDPDQDDGFQVGQGDAPVDTTAGAPHGDAPSSTAPSSVVDSVASRLGESAKPETEQGRENAPAPQNAMPFDITKLSKEQLQTLKAMLNDTPEGQIREAKNPEITLRKIDGNYVIDFKNAILGIVKDPETGRDIERHLIPVRFKGTEEFVNVLYSKFINAERVPCEVLSHKEEKKPIVEGAVYSRERGRNVDMVRHIVNSYFTIKLPEGETLEIEGRLANA